jgi:hypothetical protein
MNNMYEAFGTSTFPKKKECYWQLVLMPTISVYTSKCDGHTAINMEWLFWCFTILKRPKDKIIAV